MNRTQHLKHEFVEFLPTELTPGILYVSISFATVAHSCCCGCGLQVITPLSPTDWKLTFDGESISLDPSIGNWNFPCRSHYWIKRNRVEWAGDWSKSQIAATRSADAAAKKQQFHSVEPVQQRAKQPTVATNDPAAPLNSRWQRMVAWLSGRQL